MSDADLRELERRFCETSSVEDEAAWLRARVQAGELERSRLELAAALDHFPAREALSHAQGRLNLTSLLTRLGELSDLALVRGVLALAYAVLPAWKEEQPQSEEPEPLMRLLEGWLVDSAPDFFSLAMARWEDANNLMLQTDGWASERADLAYRTCLFAVSVALRAAGHVDLAPEEAATRIREDAATCGEFACARAGSPLTEREALKALSTELVPWLLSYRDPVRERVEARRRAEVAGE